MSAPLTLASAVPASLRAGDAWSWSVQTGLAYGSAFLLVLTGVVDNQVKRILLGGTAGSGEPVDHAGVATMSVVSQVSAAYAAGRYEWVAFGIDGSGARTELACGKVTVRADVVGAAPVDPRTENRKLLDQVRALLKGKALDDVAMYKIGTRELTKMSTQDLLKWEAMLEARVRRENRRKAGDRNTLRTSRLTFGGR